MESRQKLSGNKNDTSHQNGSVTPRDIIASVNTPRKQASVEIIITEPNEIDKTNKTENTATAKNDTKEESRVLKTNKLALEAKEKTLAKHPVKGGLLRGAQNEQSLKGNEKGKKKLTALMRLKGSVHTIQALSKLSRYSFIFIIIISNWTSQCKWVLIVWLSE